MQMQDKSQDVHNKLVHELAASNTTMKELRKVIQDKEIDLGIETERLETVESTKVSEEFKEKHIENLQALRMKYAGFDPEQLNVILTFAKAHMLDGQLLCTNV